ncbi:MAG: ParB/RepB/Spo0J family partition protein [Bacteroidales bacterium]
MTKKMALGRGLGAIISDASTIQQSGNTGSGTEIELSKIQVNPNQPRTKFDEEALKELSESIKAVGLIQPITVREIGQDLYQIISGERRYRASLLAGLTTIPAYIRKTEDEQMLALALIENIQRENLDAIEIAVSFQRLIDECNLTHEQLSEKVGKKRSTITNYLRLLKLPAEIQLGIRNEQISMGHARAISSLETTEDQLMLFHEVITNHLSVRDTEEYVKNFNAPPSTHIAANELSESLLIETNQFHKDEKTTENKQTEKIIDESYLKLENQLKTIFNTPIKFKRNNKGKGEIIIPFNTDEELERIIGLFERYQNQ